MNPFGAERLNTLVTTVTAVCNNKLNIILFVCYIIYLGDEGSNATTTLLYYSTIITNRVSSGGYKLFFHILISPATL